MVRMSRSTPSRYRAHTRLVPRQQRHHILSPLWKSRTARALHQHLSMRSRQPRARLHPVQLPSFGATPKRSHRVEPKKYSAVDQSFPRAPSSWPSLWPSPWASLQAQVGPTTSQSHDIWVNRSVAMPRGIGACFEKRTWECHEPKTGEACLATVHAWRCFGSDSSPAASRPSRIWSIVETFV